MCCLPPLHQPHLFSLPSLCICRFDGAASPPHYCPNSKFSCPSSFFSDLPKQIPSLHGVNSAFSVPAPEQVSPRLNLLMFIQEFCHTFYEIDYSEVFLLWYIIQSNVQFQRIWFAPNPDSSETTDMAAGFSVPNTVGAGLENKSGRVLSSLFC